MRIKVFDISGRVNFTMMNIENIIHIPTTLGGFLTAQNTKL